MILRNENTLHLKDHKYWTIHSITPHSESTRIENDKSWFLTISPTTYVLHTRLKVLTAVDVGLLSCGVMCIGDGMFL